MNKMKNSFLMMAFVCLFTVVALCSCSKDDDDDDYIITAKVEGGNTFNDNIDVVKAVFYNYEDDNYVESSSSKYSNGGFTLKLPEPVSDTYLDALDDFPDGVTVSNPNVKTGGSPYIYAYRSEKRVGEFYYSSSSSLDDFYADYVYSNGDVSVTGAATYYYEGITDEIYTYQYNVHLKKGWNIVYGREIDKGNGEYEYEETTQEPSATLKWYYSVFASTHGVRAKKVPSLLSKSRIRL